MLGKIYYWLWHDLLQRKEPFTFQFRRMAGEHPVIFWGGFGVLFSFFASGLSLLIWYLPHHFGVW